MSTLTRFWTIKILVPAGTFDYNPNEHYHIETFGTSWQAFDRIQEIRAMFGGGEIPTMPINLISEPLHRIA